MSAFVIARTVFFVMLGMLVAVDVFFIPVDFSFYLLLVLLFCLLIAAGSSVMRLQFFMPAFTNISTPNKIIALTFDDGPHPEYTPVILELLEKYDAKASFFCIGKHVKEHPRLTKSIKDKGHAVGNHSYSHSNLFPLFGKKKIKDELEYTNALIAEATGKAGTLFRPPFGITNPKIASAVNSLSLKTIGWSIRSFDTSAAPEKVIKRVTSRIKPGSVILLHDNRVQTLKILEAILLYAQKNNYKCVPITDELILK